MAITPRTILTSAAPATIAVISLYVFTALGTMAYKSGRDASHDHDFSQKMTVQTIVIPSSQDDNCREITDAYGADKREWTESAWITYAACFDYQKKSTRVISVASQGLKYYPHSETLYNLVGYHQIVLGEHEEAVNTLRTGISRVASPQSGVMANNLAWAGLWNSRSMPLDEARLLYRQSLALSPGSCETTHTALWVEYATVRNTTGQERAHALNRFQSLSQMYAPCMSRVQNADWNTLVEIIGATTIIDDIEQQKFGTSHTSAASVHATRLLLNNHRGATADQVCSDAMPLAETHQKCVASLQNNLQRMRDHQRVVRQRSEHPQRSYNHAKRTHCGGISR